MDSNRLKAWLAVLITIGFLGCIYILFFIPEVAGPSRDLLLVLLGVLCAIVKDVFGYFFGSSEGSARKTELLSQADPIEPRTLPLTAMDDRGFLRLSLLPALLLVALLIGGCASLQKQTPEALATKSLLSMKEVVIGVAESADALCTKGVLNQVQCDQVRDIYGKAGVSYNITAALLTTAIKAGGDKSAWDRYRAAQGEFLTVYNDALAVGSEFGLIKEGR